MGKKNNKQIAGVRSDSKKSLLKLDPLKEHPIASCEAYVQKQYLTMLYVVAQYESDSTEKPFLFIQRILAATKLKGSFSEYVKKAMELTVEALQEFIHQCEENNLQDIFIIDSLLVACADGKMNQKQAAFLAELAAALRISKKQLNWSAKLIKVILEQNQKEYQTIYDTIPKNEKNKIFPVIICYLREFVDGVLIVDTDDLLWVYAKEKMVVDLLKIYGGEITGKKLIRLTNLVVKKYGDKKVLNLNGNNIEINNCVFVGVELAVPVSQKIIIKHSSFIEESSGYHNQRIYLKNVSELKLYDTKFKNIDIGGLRGTREDALIRHHSSTNELNVEIEQCIFEKINNDWGAAILFDEYANTSVKIENSEFKYCVGDCLFLNIKDIGGSNCSLVESADLAWIKK